MNYCSISTSRIIIISLTLGYENVFRITFQIFFPATVLGVNYSLIFRLI